MKLQEQTTRYVLDKNEQFRTTKEFKHGRDEIYLITHVVRCVYSVASGGRLGLMLRAEGPRIRLDGNVGSRIGGVNIHGSSDQAVETLEAMPIAVLKELTAIGFFEEPANV